MCVQYAAQMFKAILRVLTYINASDALAARESNSRWCRIIYGVTETVRRIARLGTYLGI